MVLARPALLDGGTPATDQIASLTKFVTLQAGKPNTVDCAIAKPLSMSLVSDEVLFIGAPQGTAAAAIDMAVHNCVETAATFHSMFHSMPTCCSNVKMSP